MLLVPQFIFQNVSHISSEFLKEQGITVLALDIDNTLALHDDGNIPAYVESWLNEMRKAGFQMVLLSNNNAERVQPFAESIKLPFIPKAHKPLTFGIKRLMKLCGETDKRHVAVIGDQLFTDRLTGNFAGITSITTLPLGPETKWYIKLKRVLEKPFFALFFLTGGTVR